MNCYDCDQQGQTSPALAVCHDCGAGICTQHASEAEHHLTVNLALNMQGPVEPPQRRIRCLVCAEALAAAKARRYK